jgi:hypothetical protein
MPEICTHIHCCANVMPPQPDENESYYDCNLFLKNKILKKIGMRPWGTRLHSGDIHHMDILPHHWSTFRSWSIEAILNFTLTSMLGSKLPAVFKILGGIFAQVFHSFGTPAAPPQASLPWNVTLSSGNRRVWVCFNWLHYNSRRTTFFYHK